MEDGLQTAQAVIVRVTAGYRMPVEKRRHFAGTKFTKLNWQLRYPE